MEEQDFLEKKTCLIQEYKNIKVLEKKMQSPKKEGSLAKAQASIEARIPPKAAAFLEGAFFQAFRMVFQRWEKFTGDNEKTEEIKEEYERNLFSLSKSFSKKNLKRFEKEAAALIRKNKLLTTAEGAALGALGIGLPDIVLFLEIVLRSVMEIGLCFGCCTYKEDEKLYILSILCMSAVQGEDKQVYSNFVDAVGKAIDTGSPIEKNGRDLLKDAAKLMADSMLAAKAIQGIPAVGIAGGAYNYFMLQRISRTAVIKYKKRFLFALGRQMGRD